MRKNLNKIFFVIKNRKTSLGIFLVVFFVSYKLAINWVIPTIKKSWPNDMLGNNAFFSPILGSFLIGINFYLFQKVAYKKMISWRGKGFIFWFTYLSGCISVLIAAVLLGITFCYQYQSHVKIAPADSLIFRALSLSALISTFTGLITGVYSEYTLHRKNENFEFRGYI